MNAKQPRIGTFPWSQLGRVGIWNNNYDEYGNVDGPITDAQWEVTHGHTFVKRFNTHWEAAAYVRQGLRK